MKQRIYIDTSVFGGHYDEEFKEHTIPLFERIKDGEFIILYSTVTQDELENAPEKVKELVKSLRTDLTEFIELQTKQLIWRVNTLLKKLLDRQVMLTAYT